MPVLVMAQQLQLGKLGLAWFGFLPVTLADFWPAPRGTGGTGGDGNFSGKNSFPYSWLVR